MKHQQMLRATALPGKISNRLQHPIVVAMDRKSTGPKGTEYGFPSGTA